MRTIVQLADERQMRAAFQEFLKQYKTTPTDVARRAGLPTPNALYNFLHGRARSLSHKTIPAIVRAFPDLTVDRLLGRTCIAAPSATGTSSCLQIKLHVASGEWRQRPAFPPHDQVRVPMPIPDRLHSAGVFGAVVREPGAELLFPEGTILVCLPPRASEVKLADGAIVLVECVRGGKVEVSVRQIVRNGGESWLWPRSTHARHQQPIPLPFQEPISRSWTLDGTARFTIYAVVIGAYCQFTALAA